LLFSARALDMQCPKRDELSGQAIKVLGHLNHLTLEQIECLRNGNQKRLLEIDSELELTFGEKERAFGALREHSKEHGC